MAPPVAGVDGNWKCSGCQNVNFAVRTSCNRCHLPQSGAEGPAYGGGGGAGGAPVEGMDGNWKCAGCSNVNYAGRTACNRCSAPRGFGSAPQVVVFQQAPQGVVRGSKTHSGAPIPGVDGNWACAVCQNVNFPARQCCNICQSPKPQDRSGSRTASGAPIPGMGGNWVCGACSNVNFPARSACNRCQAAKPPGPVPSATPMYYGPSKAPSKFPNGAPIPGVGGNWACEGCGNVNFSVRTACNICQTPKPQQGGRKAGGAPKAGVDGNWSCTVCSNVNFSVRTECNKCQAPKPDADFETLLDGELSTPTADGAAQTASRGPPVAGQNGNWACPACSNVNFAVRKACNRCQAPRVVQAFGGKGGSKGAPVAGVNGNWACAQCQNVNFAVRDVCNRCQAAKPQWGPNDRRRGPPVAGVDGNWGCDSCGNVNFATRDACNKCQMPRPQTEENGKTEEDFAGDHDVEPPQKRMKVE